MPTTAVPAEPIPAHTAYAVPKGRTFNEKLIIQTHSTAATIETALGNIFV